jgi:hypothetical protein
MTITGRLGIWSSPSSSIGSNAAAAREAGIIIRLCLWNRSSFLFGFLKVHFERFPSVVFDESILRRMIIVYTTSMPEKARKAIVRAGKVRNCLRGAESCVGTYGSLPNISAGYEGAASRLTESMGSHQLLGRIYGCRRAEGPRSE